MELSAWRFFLVTMMLVHVSSKKMWLQRHTTYYFKTHRINNSMALKHLHRGKKKVVVITKFGKKNWGGLGWRGVCDLHLT